MITTNGLLRPACFIWVALFYLSACSHSAHSLQVGIHDPAMVQEGDEYYLFSTGPGITFYRSQDLTHWQLQGPALEHTPNWVATVAPKFNGHMWAPDIVHHKDLFYLYFSVSSFGSNASGIGVATNKTLDKSSKDYKWNYQGVVVQSIPERDEWNAIDPHIIFDEQGTPWMSFGSFWRGLKLVKLKDNLIELAEPQQWHTLARREVPSAVEAPFIYKRDDYYYLFVSFDKCCIGVKSTYKVMVGRSKTLAGPYVDKTGKELTDGGGSLVIGGNKRWPGLGHNSVYRFKGTDYLVLHAYEAADEGRQKLKLLPMSWDKAGWPTVNAEDLDTYQSVLAD